MEQFSTNVTIGEKYGPAMSITSQAEADEYFEACVRHTMSLGHTREQAEQIDLENLAYYAGYCDTETRERVEALFMCQHPVFGKSATA